MSSTYNTPFFKEQGTGAWVEGGGVGMIRRSTGTLAAAGTVQGDAAAVAATVTDVTGSDGTKGVILPVPKGGEEIVIANTVSAQALKVWPNSGAAINFGAANAAYSLPGQKVAIYRAKSPTQWWAVLSA